VSSSAEQSTTGCLAVKDTLCFVNHARARVCERRTNCSGLSILYGLVQLYCTVP
jgi:hypothetical protein